MRRTLLIGLLVIVLAVGGIGAAFATSIGFPTIGILALGQASVPNPFNVDYVGFHLDSAMGQPVEVDGVYLSFNQGFSNAAFSVSLRDYWGGELCYCALNGHTQGAGQTRCFQLTADSASLPSPAQVYGIRVTVAENSVYNAPPASGWVIGP